MAKKNYVINVSKMARKLGQATDQKGTESELCEFMELTQPTVTKWKKKAPNIIQSLMRYSEVTGESIESIIEEI